MRADRLIATLLLLQARPRVTALELSRELEVSVATARRDLLALSSAGIPVYPQPGRGGGWALLGGARTDLTGLTERESQALFLLLGPAASRSPDARSALRKLLRAVPAPFREDAVVAADALVADETRWNEDAAPPPPLVALLERAVVDRSAVRLSYAGWQQEARVRRVEPWGLAEKSGTWYLLAGTDKGHRTYRIDRIRAAEPTGERFERPADLDLPALWREVVSEVEQQTAAAEAVVHLDARLLPFLRRQFGRHCAVEQELGDGRLRVRVGAPTLTMAARLLAGWGEHAEVVAPPELRDELARIGRELTAQYG